MIGKIEGWIAGVVLALAIAGAAYVQAVIVERDHLRVVVEKDHEIGKLRQIVVDHEAASKALQAEKSKTDALYHQAKQNAVRERQKAIVLEQKLQDITASSCVDAMSAIQEAFK